jgi:type IV pilus assembly protein PilA
MRPDRQHGYTLIELMIVVVIIGIIAALAVPQYLRYSTRTKIAEGLNLTAAAKTAAVEYFTTTLEFPSSNASAGLAPKEQISSKYVKSVEVTTSGTVGTIIVTYRDAVGLPGEPTLEIRATVNPGAVDWRCAGGTLDENYRPRECR